MHPTDLHIAISLHVDKLPSGEQKHGQTSVFFERMLKAEGERKCRVFTKSSNFIMSEDPSTPQFYCGAGTGVVPFIGFMQERELWLKAGKTLGPAHLFFGCKYRDVDFIYREQMTDSVDTKVITELHLAFSREDPKQKLYV